MELKPPKFAVEFTGNFRFHTHFPWFIYRPYHHQLRGDEVDEITAALLPGDILLRRFPRYLNTLLTPGYWGHAGMYIGDRQIIHAVSEGVIKENILNFCRTDSLTIQRIIHEDFDIRTRNAVNFVEGVKGAEYDFDFVLGDDKYSCSELINAGYKPMFKKDYQKVIGKLKITFRGPHRGITVSQWVITPQGIYESKATKTVLEYRKGKKV